MDPDPHGSSAFIFHPGSGYGISRVKIETKAKCLNLNQTNCTGRFCSSWQRRRRRLTIRQGSLWGATEGKLIPQRCRAGNNTRNVIIAGFANTDPKTLFQFQDLTSSFVPNCSILFIQWDLLWPHRGEGADYPGPEETWGGCTGIPLHLFYCQRQVSYGEK